MAITTEELARRLRVARETCRLTQEEVGRQLGLSRASVVQLEAGKRAVSSIELQQLAFLFGRDIRDFVAEEAFSAEDSLVALFRAETDAGGRPQMQAKLRECVALGREAKNLERLLNIERDLTRLVSYGLASPNSRWTAVDQGNRLAEDERRRLGLRASGIPDLAELLESIGVRTGIVELPKDVSGVTLDDRELGAFVIVNRAHAATRRRFSLAHEYAHVLVDRARRVSISRDAERAELAEVRANAFAAAFLMPEEGVMQFVAQLGKGKPSRSHADVFDEADSLVVEGRAEPGSQAIQLYDVVRLAHHFEVSVGSALFRLKNLKLVTVPEFEVLRALDSEGKARQLEEALGLREPERNDRAFESRFLALALEAVRRELISHGKLRDLVKLIGRSPREAESLIAAAGIE